MLPDFHMWNTEYKHCWQAMGLVHEDQSIFRRLYADTVTGLNVMFPFSLIYFPTLWYGNKPDRCCMLGAWCAVNKVYCCSNCCHGCWTGWAAALPPAGLSHGGVTTQILHHTAHFTFFGFYLSLGFCLTFKYWEMRSWKTAVRDGLV